MTKVDPNQGELFASPESRSGAEVIDLSTLQRSTGAVNRYDPNERREARLAQLSDAGLDLGLGVGSHVEVDTEGLDADGIEIDDTSADPVVYDPDEKANSARRHPSIAGMDNSGDTTETVRRPRNSEERRAERAAFTREILAPARRKLSEPKAWEKPKRSLPPRKRHSN